MPKNIATNTFLRDDAGAATLWWTVWMIAFLVFSGVAVDTANAHRMRTELQATADAAAHAAVIDLPNQDIARATALGMASTNMSPRMHGDVLTSVDVEFGSWNGATQTFTLAEPGVAADAVRVTTRRDANNANQLPTYFLRLIGFDKWNVNARAIAQRYYPECLQHSAIVAAKVVDFQSNSVFYPGICIHGNDHVEINNGNLWYEGVQVTMPDLADFVIPDNSHQKHNPGIDEALASEWFYPKIIDKIGNLLASYQDVADPLGVWPSYIGKDLKGAALVTDPTPATCTGKGKNRVCKGGSPGGLPVAGADLIKTVNASAWSIDTYKPGYVYNINCAKPTNTFNIGATATKPLRNVVLIANCNVKIGNNGLAYNAVIGSTAGLDAKVKPSDSIIDLGQGTQLGLDDNCAPGNDVKILSTASVNGPANTTYFGVQMLARQNVKIAAKAQGVNGINIQARNVDWTSNNSFGPNCSEVADLLKVPYFRLVY